MYQGRINSRALAINMQRSKDILQWSPFSWVRRVMGMSQAWNVNYKQKGTMIYAFICNTTGKVYVGQTGGKRNVRSLIQRFKEHVRDSLNWKWEQRKARFHNGEEGLHAAMYARGPEGFLIVPLEIVRKHEVDSKEYKWIARFGTHVWNLQTEARWKNKQQWQKIHSPPSAPVQRIDYAMEAKNAISQPSRTVQLSHLLLL